MYLFDTGIWHSKKSKQKQQSNKSRNKQAKTYKQNAQTKKAEYLRKKQEESLPFVTVEGVTLKLLARRLVGRGVGVEERGLGQAVWDPAELMEGEEKEDECPSFRSLSDPKSKCNTFEIPTKIHKFHTLSIPRLQIRLKCVLQKTVSPSNFTWQGRRDIPK